MITNACCTAARLSREGESVYAFFPAVMWQGKQGVSVNSHGEETDDRTVIFIPGTAADILPGNYVCKGDKAAFSRADALRVMSVQRCDYGSPDMRHLRLEAV